jgi:hypothetical protein
MNQTETLRAKFAELSTETLCNMWATEARAKWAEDILREDLLARGIARGELDDIEFHREEIATNLPPSPRDTLWKFGYVGRMAAIAGSVAAYFLFHSLFGTRAATYAMASVFAIYTVILVRRVFFQSQFRASGTVKFAMTWQCLEAVLILFGIIIIAATLPSHA